MASAATIQILIADDDVAVLRVLAAQVREWGYQVLEAATKKDILDHLNREQPSLVLLDLHFGEHNGIELMQTLLQKHPELRVIVLTGYGTIDSAVAAIKLGAYDYLTKPPDLQRLRVILGHVAEELRLNRRIKSLEQVIDPDDSLGKIWGNSRPIALLRELIASVGPTDATVLILGESGTGKELVARALHEQSERRQEPFVAVNMAALPSGLVESTLFGHEKGAFTSADKVHIGCCEAADHGTLFLDEIGEMDLDIQAKLLRFLQERKVQRVGSNEPKAVDVRVLAATNRDLEERVRTRAFREDLFYRLNVVPLEVPALRERTGDIPLLASRFLQRAGLRLRKEMSGLTEAALELFSGYSWPGNVRQLENLVERLVILSRGGAIDRDDIPAEIRGSVAIPRVADMPVEAPAEGSLRRIDLMEKQAIVEALQRVSGNVREAAKILGLGQATVYRKIKRFGIAIKESV